MWCEAKILCCYCVVHSWNLRSKGLPIYEAWSTYDNFLSLTHISERQSSDVNVCLLKNGICIIIFSKENNLASKPELVRKLVPNHSTHPSKPVLANFPFKQSEFSNNTYSIFSFEQVNYLFLGKSKMRKGLCTRTFLTTLYSRKEWHWTVHQNCFRSFEETIQISEIEFSSQFTS